MKDNKKYFDFVLKYPELVYSFYKNKRWYNKQLNQNQISGYISIDILKQRIEDGFIPVIHVSRLYSCMEYYKADKNIFKKYENLINEFNSLDKT